MCLIASRIQHDDRYDVRADGNSSTITSQRSRPLWNWRIGRSFVCCSLERAAFLKSGKLAAVLETNTQGGVAWKSYKKETRSYTVAILQTSGWR